MCIYTGSDNEQIASDSATEQWKLRNCLGRSRSSAYKVAGKVSRSDVADQAGALGEAELRKTTKNL